MSSRYLFCVQECTRQKDNAPLMVLAMMQALAYADHYGKDDPYGFLTEKNVIHLGKMVKPFKVKGYRNVPVHFANGNTGCPPGEIADRMARLLTIAFKHRPAPVEFYKQFEEIHPFVDGNGRVGVILFNLLNGTLDDPIPAPDIFREEP